VKQAKNASSITTLPQDQPRDRTTGISFVNRMGTVIRQYETEFQDQDTSQVKDNVKENCQEYETEMISLITQYFSNYLQMYPTDKHSMFIQKCFQNDLTQATDITSFRKSLSATDNNRLLMILRKSAALKDYMIFSIEQDQTITYELTQRAMQELDNKSFMHRHEILTSEHLEVFHSKILPYIKLWAHNHPSEFYADMWIDVIENGLNHFSTWNQIKNLLDITNMTEYFHSIEECDNITTQFQCNFDFTTNKFTYMDPSQTAQASDNRSEPKNHNVDQSSHVSSPVVNIVVPPPVTLQTTNLTMHHNLHAPDFEEDPIMTDDDQDTIPTIDNDLPWQPYHPENNFSFVHSIVFHYIEQWATLTLSKSHSFYPQLQRFK
jgi:hypothetical protein